MVRIDDPKQNQHCWCGILKTDDDGMTLQTGKLLPNKKYIFWKLNQESHFISHGTIINDAFLVDEDDAIKRLDKALELVDPTFFKGRFDKIKQDITDCKKVDGVDASQFVIITGVDYEETSPLANDINALTKGFFTYEKWLQADAGRKGSQDIRIGMALPPMPFPK